MKRICGCCKFELDLPYSNNWEGEEPREMLVNSAPSDTIGYVAMFGIWNQREQKPNWICGACLSEKLGIAAKGPRGGFF